MPRYIYTLCHEKDLKWLERLRTASRRRLKQNGVALWHQSQVEAGVNLQQQQAEILAQTPFVLLLASPDLLADPDFEQWEEMDCKTIWLPLRFSDYLSTDLAEIQPLWSPLKPLASLTEHEVDQALVTITQQLGALLEKPSANTEALGKRLLFTPNAQFVGRARDLEILEERLTQGQDVAVVALTGFGGVGKTQLASQFAHRYGQAFPGGVFWLSMADPEEVPQEVAACARAMGRAGDQTPLEQAVEAARQVWSGETPCLLIFDNCEDPELFSKWRPQGGGARVLLTSRRSTWPPHLLHTHALEVLSPEESRALLEGLCPRLTKVPAITSGAKGGSFASP